MHPPHETSPAAPDLRPIDWAPYPRSPFPRPVQSGHPAPTHDESKLAALVELGKELMLRDYAWVCPSPETQTLVNSRFSNRRALSLTELFGWNRVGSTEILARQLPQELVAALCETGVLRIHDGETVQSRVRFSSFADSLLAHSAWPAHEGDDVVVGPETHRFGAFLAREMLGPLAPTTHDARPFTVVDLGCGSGAAGILAARMLGAMAGGRPTRVLLTDRRPRALRFAEVNARLANLPHFECRRSDLLSAVDAPPMLVLANPPGLLHGQPAAQHGAGELGTGLALQILDECLDQMLPGGTLLMCAVAPVVRGEDILLRSVKPRIMRTRGKRPAQLRYQVLETDVLAHQLALPECAEVDRFSVVGLAVQLKASS